MPFRPAFDIGGVPVGPGAPCFIIAEAGVAHFGDMVMAQDLVDMAAEAGADAFKTQIFDVDRLYRADAADWRNRLRGRNLTLDQCHDLKARCDLRGILFIATAHDESRVSWLRELDVPAVKVGSGERNNPAFLAKMARLGKPMIVSTGMYASSDVEEALAACASGGCDRVALLHCVTSYPTPHEDVNLAAMDTLRTLFPGPVGYSDHTATDLACLAAVARGARVIERHITIKTNVENAQDWKVSSGPEDFARLVSDIRAVEAMIGHGRKEPAPCEAGALWALKSLVAVRDLPAGHILKAADMVAKRPGDGLSPNRRAEVVGKRLKVACASDSPVRPEHVG